MRLMHWTWQEYEATPAHVVSRLIEIVNTEREEQDT